MQHDIYFAGPLFTTAEMLFNTAVADELREKGLTVFLPQENEQGDNPLAIFDSDRQGIDNARVVVACMDGPDPDSGTCWECGYAYGTGKPVVLFRTDLRSEAGPLGPFNLMMFQSADHILECKKMSVEGVAASIAGRVAAIIEEYGL